jgi:hypothetical protein
MISGTFNFMIVFQAEHNILMHPFHMLGKHYASPPVHSLGSYLSEEGGKNLWFPFPPVREKSTPVPFWWQCEGTLIGFCLYKSTNLFFVKRRLSTHLNGENSLLGFFFFQISLTLTFIINYVGKIQTLKSQKRIKLYLIKKIYYEYE